MRPPNFESIIYPLRYITHVDPNDGVKVDIGMGLSQRLQITNTWSLPHGAPGNY